MHCHILPAVDDGSRSEDMTRQMFTRARSAGIEAIVATPHYGAGQHDLSKIERSFSFAKSVARQMNIKLHLGYEVNYRVMMDLDASRIGGMCVFGTNSLLLELDETTLFPRWEFVLSDLCKNYAPVIVHPERFFYIQKDFALISEMKSYGCEIQLDAVGLTRGLLNPEGRTARKLLNRGLVDYIASDAHHPRDYDAFEVVRRRYASSWPSGGELNRVLC